MFFNLETCLQSKINLGSSCPLNAKSSKTLALVAKLPFFVFFKEAILSSLYMISPSCFVEAILNSFFDILKIFFSKLLIFFSNFLDKSFKNLLSILTP